MSKSHKIIYAIILLSLSSLIEVSAGEYSVIVNKNIRFTGSENEQITLVKRLFLKKQSKWPSGIKAKPINFKSEKPEYQAFITNVLGMSESEVTSYWGSVRAKSGVTPPSGVGNYRVVLKLVARAKGGIGYIENADLKDLPDTVKVLFEF